jgi:nitroreductase
MPGAETPHATAGSVMPEALLQHFRQQRSGREYRQEPVAREHLAGLLAAAALAPSGLNARVVRAHVYTDPAALSAIREATLVFYRMLLRILHVPGTLALLHLTGQTHEQLQLLRAELAELVSDGEDRLFYDAPALLVFTLPRRHPTGEGDAWLASHNAMLYAATIPLATCYNGFLAMAAGKSARVRHALCLPRDERVVAAFTAGYPRLTYRRCPPRPPIPTTWR